MQQNKKCGAETKGQREIDIEIIAPEHAQQVTVVRVNVECCGKRTARRISPLGPRGPAPSIP